jgi:hypothetical protein
VTKYYADDLIKEDDRSGHVERGEKNRDIYAVLVGKLGGKRRL